jgi:DNA replication protein DnaC
VKNARFRYSATLEDLNYDVSRGIDKAAVTSLATCDYIRKGVSVLITGPAGTGKSWLATALGYQACLNGYKVMYVYSGRYPFTNSGDTRSLRR